MSIYIVAHKQFQRPEEPGYRVILAGAAGNADANVDRRSRNVNGGDASFREQSSRSADSSSREQYWDVRDDEGEDNISAKNPSFCELTALYWLWKYCGDDVIGLVHYRRYFSNQWSNHRILPEKTARKILKHYDIILPQIAFQKLSMRDEFVQSCGTYEDLDVLREIVCEKSPEYLEAFEDYFHGKRTCFMNMMICRQELFREYCAWLFPILFEMEKRVDLSGRSAYQKRLFGFLGERLLNVWVMKNHLRACHIFLLETDKQYPLPLDLVYRCARTGTYILQNI